jgi:hypothetical protein
LPWPSLVYACCAAASRPADTCKRGFQEIPLAPERRRSARRLLSSGMDGVSIKGFQGAFLVGTALFPQARKTRPYGCVCWEVDRRKLCQSGLMGATGTAVFPRSCGTAQPRGSHARGRRKSRGNGGVPTESGRGRYGALVRPLLPGFIQRFEQLAQCIQKLRALA